MPILKFVASVATLLSLGSLSAAYSARLLGDLNHQTKASVVDRNAGDRAFEEAERLRAVQTTQSNRKALRFYEDALSVWRRSSNTKKEVETLTSIGELQHLLNEPRKAIDYYQLGLSLNQKTKEARLEARLLSRIAAAYKHLGENQKALGYCTKSLQIARELSDPQLEAEALNSLGDIYTALGDLFKALDCFRDALRIASAANDQKDRAQAQLNLGYSYSDLGDVREALASYNEAAELWRVVNDRRGEALTLIAIGHLRSRLGEKQEALYTFIQALKLIKSVGDRVWEGSAIAGIAYIYDGFGEKQRSLEYYTRTLVIFKSIGFRKGEANALYAIGRIYKSLGQTKQALVFYQKGLSIVRSIGDRRLEAYGIKYLGAAYEAIGQKERALNLYDSARLLYKAGGDRRGEASALNSIGSILLERGDREQALGLYREALSLNRETSERFEESSTLYNIARAQRNLESFAEGRKTIETAIDLIETCRAKVTNQDLRASYFATVQQNYELYIDLLMRSHAVRPSDELASIALRASERRRARSLIEMLAEARADIRQGVDSTLLDQERGLQQRLTDKEERYSRLLTSRRADEQTSTTAREIEEIRDNYRKVKEQIRATSPRYAALTQPQPLTLKEIQEQVLDQGTLLLEYALGDERSYLWAVTTDSVKSFELPKRADIESTARRVYALLTAENQIVKGETPLRKQQRMAQAEGDYAKAAALLSETLLGPVASQLETKRLLIVADGALQYIPFGALPTPIGGIARNFGSAAGDTDHRIGENLPSSRSIGRLPIATTQPLVVDHEIVSLPSASTLAVMRRELAGRKPAPKAVAVLADPVFSSSDPRVSSSRGAASREFQPVSVRRDFERAIRDVRVSRKRGGVARLPFSRTEADAIRLAAPAGQALEAVDFDASRATAISAELSQYRIVHFATHGLLNSEHPELSGMVFSLVDRRGKQQNGFLRLHEVYNLNLPAELVVLSACQTGLGKDVKGEGLIGLTRGFMYAGASRVVASLWQVDDVATAELMQRFYTKMLRDGLRPAAALRDAQVEMWKQNRWKMPYYWAGFTLQGEWK